MFLVLIVDVSGRCRKILQYHFWIWTASLRLRLLIHTVLESLVMKYLLFIWHLSFVVVFYQVCYDSCFASFPLYLLRYVLIRPLLNLSFTNVFSLLVLSLWIRICDRLFFIFLRIRWISRRCFTQTFRLVMTESSVVCIKI